MKLTFDQASVNYIGNSYFEEFKEVGLIKPVPLDKAIDRREKIKSGKLIKIPYGTRFEYFLWSMIEADNTPKLSNYRLVYNEIIFA